MFLNLRNSSFKLRIKSRAKVMAQFDGQYEQVFILLARYALIIGILAAFLRKEPVHVVIDNLMREWLPWLQDEMIPEVSKDQEALLITLKRPVFFVQPAAFDKGTPIKFSVSQPPDSLEGEPYLIYPKKLVPFNVSSDCET